MLLLLLLLSCFSHPTLCDPIDSSQRGSSVPGILQARMLEWVVISSPRESSQPWDRPASPALQENSLPLSHQGGPRCGNTQALILRVTYIYLGSERMSQNVKKKGQRGRTLLLSHPLRPFSFSPVSLLFLKYQLLRPQGLSCATSWCIYCLTSWRR